MADELLGIAMIFIVLGIFALSLAGSLKAKRPEEVRKATLRAEAHRRKSIKTGRNRVLAVIIISLFVNMISMVIGASDPHSRSSGT